MRTYKINGINYHYPDVNKVFYYHKCTDYTNNQLQYYYERVDIKLINKDNHK